MNKYGCGYATHHTVGQDGWEINGRGMGMLRQDDGEMTAPPSPIIYVTNRAGAGCSLVQHTYRSSINGAARAYHIIPRTTLK